MSLLPFPMLEQVGQHFVFDRFMDLIGEGSFAYVYKAIRKDPLPAFDMPANSAVALKVIPKSKLDCDRSIRDVIKEVEIGRKLKHPGCVRVLEVLQSATDIFIVMELVEGVELFELIRASPKGRLTERQACAITHQLLSIANYLHVDCRVVHRDLKPENVLISGEFESVQNPLRVRVVDFGLAKYIGTSQRRGRLLAGGMSANRIAEAMHAAQRSHGLGFDSRLPARSMSTASVDSVESTSSHTSSPLLTTPCGTLKYNAPEAVRNMVLNGGELQRTTKGDLVKREMFSIGIVVYVMLSGQLPFTGKTKSALFEQMSEGASLASCRWACVSDVAKDFVASLLDVDPSQRPTAAQALRHPWLEPHAPSPDRSSNKAAPSPTTEDDDNENVAVAMGRDGMAEAFDAMNFDPDDDRPVGLPSDRVPHTAFIAHQHQRNSISVEED
jgi:serine/threonine protein kinase